MPRKARENQNETNFYHIMVQGINKEYIFDKERLMKKYLELMLENIEKTEVKIIAYCIMNNHVHLLMYSEDTSQMSKTMQKINSSYAKYYNWTKERVGYVFRDRYLSQPIRNDAQLINCVKYIHNNPVKAKMVNKPEEYAYSNYLEFYSQNNIEKLKKLTNINFNQISENELYMESEFFDIDTNIEQKIKDCIKMFCCENGINIFEIFAEREILSQAIKYLKEDCKIKYTEMRSVLEISRGIMENLKQ